VYDVNSAAILCARKVLAHPEVAADYVQDVNAGRRVLEGRLSEQGFDPLNSRTNFMVVRVGHRVPPADLVASLRMRGYLVRGPFAAPCMADCIRITVGPPALMEAFCDVLHETVSGMPGYISPS
jgi:histidinol-phosphate aminotransferase